MTRIISKLVCPKCGGEEFLKGPEGGLAINIKCAKCGYFMNIAPLPNGKFWIINEGIFGLQLLVKCPVVDHS